MTKTKKLMSIDDLYEFCLKNNFNHFNSAETNYELSIQVKASGFFEDKSSDPHKEGLRPFVAKGYHDNVNLNKSEIEPDVFKENTKSAPFRPILAHIVTDEETGEKDFGSHDYIIEEDENGEYRVVYQEQPVGVINEDFSFEYDEEQDVTRAILRGYLYEEYCSDAIDILERRNGTDVSIELNVRQMSFNNENKTLKLDDYSIQGLTLLGKKVNPGMKGSNLTLTDFSVENNSIFSQEQFNKDLIERLAKIEESLATFNKQDNSELSSFSEEGGDVSVDKLNELLNKYGKTLEDISFETEGLSDEELEAKFAEIFEEETAEENTEVVEVEETFIEETEVIDEVVEPEEKTSEVFTKEFKIEFEISHDEIRYGLYQLITVFEEEDNDIYSIRKVYDSHFVMYGWCEGKIYGCKYKVEDDVVSLDGSRWRLHEELLTDSEKAQLDEMRSNYSVIQEKLNTYEKAELDAQKNAIFEDEAYSEYLENDEFKNLINEKDKYSVEELKTKAELAFAKCARSNVNFAQKDKSSKKHNLSSIKDPTKKKPYGSLFN